MFRFAFPAFLLGLLALVLMALLSFFGWQQLSHANFTLDDLTNRLASLETVYESTECEISSLDKHEVIDGCEIGNGSYVFLGESEADGEVRELVIVDASGTQMHVGQLPNEATYIHELAADGTAQGFMSDKTTGSVEVYAVHPRLEANGDDERLPIMIKHFAP